MLNINLLLPGAVLLPLLGAVLLYLLPMNDKGSVRHMIFITTLEMLLLGFVFFLRLKNTELSFTLEGFCGLTLKMRSDGFRAMYALIAALMWCFTSVFSRDYMANEHRVRRYVFFILLTQCASVGLLLSDSLATAFLFFEVMSLASYPWVAQEENAAAMRAAETYLYVAIIGGLVMLMGLLMLPAELPCASFSQIGNIAAKQELSSLMLPSCLLLVGFGAKAGVFPLHIWLPKAHPVAPAPASALLSGLLTKAGLFGVLVLSCYIMKGYLPFAKLIFWLGVITMFLGALLAVFAVNLKRTLACSSLSQIGFIMVGIGTLALCGGNNAHSAWGTVGHMVNHSLLKLLLFLCAGVVAMNAHALELNDIRGFGRKKPFLHAVFLVGLLGIGGIPLFNGYISKSLLHEGLLEWIAEAPDFLPYKIAEWVFIISGGMTLCYMLKLYICLFWQKNPDGEVQTAFDDEKEYLSLPSKIALGITAVILLLIGLQPQTMENTFGSLSESFLNASSMTQAPDYFSGENLIGALKSILIGIALYFVCRKFLFERDADGNLCYSNRWPDWLDLENILYRPLLKLLCLFGKDLSRFFCAMPEICFRGLLAFGGVLARLCSMLIDQLIFLACKVLFPHRGKKEEPVVGNQVSWSLGRAADRIVAGYTKGKVHPHYETALAASWHETVREWKETISSIGFSQLMFAFGLVCVLVVVVLWK